MGCLFSGDDANKEEQSLERDMERIHEYVMGRATLDDLWLQFDSNFDSKVDMEEFSDLLYHSEVYFVRMRNPMSDEKPTKESLEARIKELSKRFNANNDARICKEEFKEYGRYLLKQKAQIQNDTTINLPDYNSQAETKQT